MAQSGGQAGAQYCPAWGPGSRVCPRSICDCFIDQFPHDMEQAGALHPELFRVVGMVEQEEDGEVRETSGPEGPWQ